MYFDLERVIWMGAEIEELTQEETEDEYDSPSWVDGIYVVDLRKE